MLFRVIAAAINAVGPVVLLILMGYLLKCRGIFTPEFLQKGNWLVFHITLPLTLFVNIYKLGSFSDVNWPVLLYCLTAVFGLFFLGLFWAMATTKDSACRGVIWQGTYRSNAAILGLAIASALGGSQAETLAAVTSSTSSALFNIFAVISLSVFSGNGGKQSISGALRKIAHNPLIIGGLLGFSCLFIREIQRSFFGAVVFSLDVQLKPVYTVIENLKSITTPFALLVLGGKFEFRAVGGLFKEIAATTIFRLLIAPLLAIGTAIMLSRAGILHCGIEEYPTLVAIFGSPVAVSSAIMATEMGGNKQLATQVVVWTSLFSVGTLFLIICVLMWMGFLAV